MDSACLVRGRWLLTGDPVGPAVIDDGALRIEAGRIAEVGPWPRLRERHPALPVLGSEMVALMPGLINAHHHTNGITSLAHGISDRLLEPWLLSLARRRPVEPMLSTLLGAARLLRTGVTAVVDVHSGRGTPEHFAEGVRAPLRAYERSGLRVAFAIGMTEQSFLVWGEDEDFLSSLPPDLRPLAAGRMAADGALTTDDYFAIYETIRGEIAANDRLALWFAPPGPQWCSDDFLERIAARAAVDGTGIQTHLLESLYEKLHGPRQYGRPTLEHLHALGLLSPRLSFAHGVWLTEKEIDLLAESGAHLSHNPSSNLRLRAGIAPLNHMAAAGVSLALGMDGTTINDDDDFFSEMRLALRLHREPQLDAPAPTVRQIFGMATTGGARLLGASADLGRLAPGFAADVVLVDLARLSWPWIAPECDPLELVVGRARAGDVATVLIGGEIVFDEGRPTHFDEVATGTELAQRLAATPIPAAEAAMVEALLPRVIAHYQGWPVPPLRPYVTYHSRR